MDKEKEIEELANSLCVYKGRNCKVCCSYVNGTLIKNCSCYHIAEVLYNAGYRKAEEVEKETAKEILQEIKKRSALFMGCGGLDQAHFDDEIEYMCYKYGVEVED